MTPPEKEKLHVSECRQAVHALCCPTGHARGGVTPADLRTARKRLGLTQHGLAKALRMGKNGYQSISRWETDGNTVPGPAQVAIEHLLKASREQK